ncbi:hypothetical protein BSL78_26760 [Apostichopus japonicus]|uniref:Uncharacterized protein n=1 Tax=Stichopus japonicus TaxID=307972 RepID=A0A2G8JL11_STIJA|nr:hypothetical protein BSL78_26760 [Apostichopus japonicus]
MSDQDGKTKVRYYRLKTDGKSNVQFQGRRTYCTNLKAAFLSVCSCQYVLSLLLLWMAWFLVWLSSNALTVSAMGKNLTIVRIPQSTANEMSAFCLDGSAPAYYYRRGRNKKWVIHFPTSELCFSLEQCMQLSRINSGSSRSLEPYLAADGFLSSNSEINPDFFNWNVVRLHPCDGGLYTGDVYAESPSVHNEVYFRGFHILKCILKWLMNKGLADADEVVISGTGVGAQTVYLHLDFIRQNLPSTARVTGLADSGFIVDVLNRTRFPEIRSAIQHLYVTHHSKGSLNQKCVAVNTAKLNEWRCLFPENVYSYITTPMFVVDSFFNAWSIWFALDLRCYPPSCENQITDLTVHGLERKERIQEIFQSKTNGLYMTSCFENDFILQNRTWNEAIVMDKDLRQAFIDWYRGEEDVPWWNYTDCFSFYACNSRCDWSPSHFLETTDRFSSQPEFYTDKH